MGSERKMDQVLTVCKSRRLRTAQAAINEAMACQSIACRRLSEAGSLSHAQGTNQMLSLAGRRDDLPVPEIPRMTTSTR